MRKKSVPEKEPAIQVVKNIRRATRRHFSAEDKIRIVLEGLRGEDSIAELCRREGIVRPLPLVRPHAKVKTVQNCSHSGGLRIYPHADVNAAAPVGQRRILVHGGCRRSYPLS
jgi:transposase